MLTHSHRRHEVSNTDIKLNKNKDVFVALLYLSCNITPLPPFPQIKYENLFFLKIISTTMILPPPARKIV
jgi:hypothetical protein